MMWAMFDERTKAVVVVTPEVLQYHRKCDAVNYSHQIEMAKRRYRKANNIKKI